MSNKDGIVHHIFKKPCYRLAFPSYYVYLSLRVVFTLTNSVDHDEMPYYVAFHLGLRCLSKYPYQGCQYKG